MAPFNFQLWMQQRKIGVGVLSRPRKGVARPNAPYMRDRHAVAWHLKGGMEEDAWLGHAKFRLIAQQISRYIIFTGYFKKSTSYQNLYHSTSVWALMIGFVETILTQFPKHWRSANQRMDSAVGVPFLGLFELELRPNGLACSHLSPICTVRVDAFNLRCTLCLSVDMSLVAI